MSTLSPDNHLELLRLIAEAEKRKGEFAGAVRAVFNVLTIAAADSGMDVIESDMPISCESLGLGSGTIAFLEHYRRILAEFSRFRAGQSLDDMGRP